MAITRASAAAPVASARTGAFGLSFAMRGNIPPITGTLTANIVDLSGSIFYQWGGTGKKKK